MEATVKVCPNCGAKINNLVGKGCLYTVLGFIVLIALIVVFSGGEKKIKYPDKISDLKINVYSTIVKKVGNKQYRYFFFVKNNNIKDFSGTIEISLIKSDDYKVNDSFEADVIPRGVQKLVYMDSTIPPSAVLNNIFFSKFEYKVITKEVMQTGNGNITQKYEDSTLYR